MVEAGLQVVANPSAALLAERQVSDGSIVWQRSKVHDQYWLRYRHLLMRQVTGTLKGQQVDLI